MLQHPALGRVRYTVTEISDDPDTQVAQTIELMRQYVLEDVSNPILKQDAATAAQGDPIADTWNYLSRKDGIRQMQFVHDEETARPWEDIGRWSPIVETLIRPVDQIVSLKPQGDCDDFAMYGAAHLLALGVPCSFCTVAADDSIPPSIRTSTSSPIPIREFTRDIEFRWIFHTVGTPAGKHQTNLGSAENGP